MAQSFQMHCIQICLVILTLLTNTANNTAELCWQFHTDATDDFSFRTQPFLFPQFWLVGKSAIMDF